MWVSQGIVIKVEGMTSAKNLRNGMEASELGVVGHKVRFCWLSLITLAFTPSVDSCGDSPWLSKREPGSPLEMEKTERAGGLSEFIPGVGGGISCEKQQWDVSRRSSSASGRCGAAMLPNCDWFL